MEKTLFIVTGASRGMGLAIARQLLSEGHRLLTLARHPNAALKGDALEQDLEQWAVDLADPLPVAMRLQGWLSAQPPQPAVLINNAGVVPPPAGLADSALPDMSNALRVGLEAPLLLSAAFLRATAGWPTPRKVLNISSGLGRRAMAGSAAYCATKAGMDHLSRALALEGATVVSLAPGIIDTDMQLALRSADPARFAEQPSFAALKSSGRLDSPEQAAAKVIAFLQRGDFGSRPVADVRDA
ncbi:MAG TPA: SDR family NAD(P)-dependent oxidoreductase [Rubrivivax sp.]|nr:SDR family NAD(P)-dependent oxidoreductase [Rubrivivax sp.]